MDLLATGLLALLAAAPTTPAATPTLLPRPQKMTVSPGAFAVAGSSVRIAGRATAEDRFAAGELAAFLASKSGTKVAVGGAGRAIVLRRTGEASPIPVPDEAAGPRGREAYELTVTPRAVEL